MDNMKTVNKLFKVELLFDASAADGVKVVVGTIYVSFDEAGVGGGDAVSRSKATRTTFSLHSSANYYKLPADVGRLAGCF
jgi:hypothetical protein